MSVELDGASLLYLFLGLPGEGCAACAQVCRSWRSVAASEVLWQRKCEELEPHPHLRRDDLLPAFGGSHRAYFAWRWPLLRRPVGRILLDSAYEQGGSRVSILPAPGRSHRAPGGAVTFELSHNGLLQQSTWSPTGAHLALVERTELVSPNTPPFRVAVVDGRSGRWLGCWAFDYAHGWQPFYFMWAACGTRLLLLSNWDGNTVALRTLDVAPALLPTLAAQHSHMPQPGEALPPADVLLCTGRPLFLDVSPTSTRLLWHSNCRHWGLADAATGTSEDGAEHDCWFENGALCQSQAPQWLVDDSGADWLLMPVMRPQQQGQQGQGQEAAAGDAGVLVLAPLAAVAEAFEQEGSRLSPALLLSLSQQVAPFSSTRHLFFAASLNARQVAWVDRGALHVAFRGSGAALQVYPPPEQPPQPAAVGGSSNAGVGGSSRDGFWRSGAVQAMQWSPDGRRLLFLVTRSGGGAPVVALALRPHYRWMVFDPPPAAVEQQEAGEAGPGGSSRLGSLTQCCPFNPTLEFLDRYLPFWDQYSRSVRLWAPDSRAFCFTSRELVQGLEGEFAEVTFASVQPVPLPPSPGPPSGTSGAGPSSSGGGGAAASEPLRMVEAPPAEALAEGAIASWSWR